MTRDRCWSDPWMSASIMTVSMNVAVRWHLRRERRQPHQVRAFRDHPFACLDAVGDLHELAFPSAQLDRPALECFPFRLHEHHGAPRVVDHRRSWYRWPRRRGVEQEPQEYGL